MSALPSRLILPGDQPLSTPRGPGLIRPVETLLRLDRPLLRGVEIYDWCTRHGIEATASIVNTMLMAGSVLPPITTVFDYTGALQTLTVPWGYHRALMRLWGAGGHGSTLNGTSVGGGAGYVMGILDVVPGSVLSVLVGGCGLTAGQAAYGGGGPALSGATGHGGGGGRSALIVGGVEVATAPGGGGGGNNGAAGGAGGGLVGSAGATGGNYGPGQGGTQTAGGALGAGCNGSAGALHQGGSGGTAGGLGGGGGHYGGGGGDGGGGGSAYIGGLTQATTLGGTGAVPGGTTDPYYATGIGVGSASGSVNGGHGRVVITLLM